VKELYGEALSVCPCAENALIDMVYDMGPKKLAGFSHFNELL